MMKDGPERDIARGPSPRLKEIQMGANTAATTDGTFETDVLKSDVPVLVDFWAEWCGPCKSLAPKLEEIAGEMTGKVKIVKLDIDNNREMTEKFGVRGIPTMILFKGGQQVNHMVGNRSKEEIVSFISSAL
jgi:thioredoxin 1